MATESRRTHRTDVLIAGAGAAGILLAAELTGNGFHCTIVEPTGIAAQQSGHSHGYLHKGYIYIRSDGAS